MMSTVACRLSSLSQEIVSLQDEIRRGREEMSIMTINRLETTFGGTGQVQGIGGAQEYVISDDPLDFQHHEAYFLATSHASEIFEWQGRWYITSCSRPVEDVEHKQDRTRGLYLAGMEWDGIRPRLRQTGVGAAPCGTWAHVNSVGGGFARILIDMEFNPGRAA